MSSKTHQEEYGWTAVPRGRSNVPSEQEAKTANVQVNFDSIWPRTELVKKSQAYVKEKLPEKTYNHSLRSTATHFRSWIEQARDQFFETWALTCLFHDIATTEENRNATWLSFEFQGGFIALQELQNYGAPVSQAESVCESIIRHQDPGETGTISRMGQLVQLATELDNMGWQPYLVDKAVIEQVVKQLLRKKWSSCFAQSIQDEIDAKPWCHTTAIPGFKEAVAGNRLMEPYD
ncbi:Cyanamide hydratase [Fulvia fulva]|uniref:Cyanamide hydratase n=1 Tax=Passalora fulva TaxID=5499 RepID=A0A9Q8UUA4_PASFU|nr:Cyanamide hydratase [Fulvia fulva]KAK4626394.1 Cyanamide hydratase [Fulvia fulva]KAK4627563.1 Cyanamide hydratase [Fulvia fulva]UJO22690.1 Cyanamide hydratase [Fulvia fulva]WPV13239.1 Cyanamide hydratase [Fulvia fulva]WPV29137.1 Cyanamide hydratase [Fulvia fulva]